VQAWTARACSPCMHRLHYLHRPPSWKKIPLRWHPPLRMQPPPHPRFHQRHPSTRNFPRIHPRTPFTSPFHAHSPCNSVQAIRICALTPPRPMPPSTPSTASPPSHPPPTRPPLPPPPPRRSKQLTPPSLQRPQRPRNLSPTNSSNNMYLEHHLPSAQHQRASRL
jgi:hypothetical protein